MSDLVPAEPAPAVSDLVPTQGFRLSAGLGDNNMPVAVGEARHELYFRPLNDVLGRPGFGVGDRGEDHALELVSSDGEVLESVPVYVGILYDAPPVHEIWKAVFEHPPDYAAYRFVHGSRIVYEKRRSLNAPEVSFLGLKQGQVFAGDAEFGFQLLIDDEDKDDLDPEILVSVDGGRYKHTYWTFNRSELRDLTVDDYGLPFTVTSGVHQPGVPRIVPAGSQSVRLLAVVSDGSRVAAAQSPVFALEPIVAALPRLQIMNMRDDETIGARGPFEIAAWVQEPRLVGDELVYLDTYHPRPGNEQAVRWTSDMDGDITEHITSSGGRQRINADALTPGTHELTATFTADSGLQASGSVIVTILGPDDPIAAIDDHLPIGVGETLEHPVTANDVETSRLIDIDTLQIVAPPKLGTAAVVDGQDGRAERVIQYTPDNLNIDYEDRLEDSLTYRICDEGPDPQCATAQLRISIFSGGYAYWEFGW